MYKITLVNARTHTPAPNDIYIGRGTALGNPYHIGRDGTRDEVCDKHIIYLTHALDSRDPYILKDLDIIRSQASLHPVNLVCHCKPLRCHGDYILSLL